ncbi:Histidine utilization repressor [Lentibacillus sp. JNUCC-1]|uniref:GntR family transcriptional regulator n=1 Tax=Lentibacillus sp. JNUCC-1 TaxID=2654513 RepID=UPI0012E7235C|nr:GntR family transcriptional regulator [Lentibacillus sp. JNUCC-1]MUV37210.1 Histidine utilization repressor [Lentibacillus sp. JNUCC-1]
MSTYKQMNKESSVFLYEQIKLHIKDMIETEMIEKGAKLPSEKELCDRFNASRITVRRALKELENEDVIEVVHGKGTFVKGHKRPIHILDLQGFTEGLSAMENQFTKKVISKEIIEADKYLMEKFDRKKPFELVKLVRIIKDEHDVFSVDFAYLPCDVYPDILPKIKDDVSTFDIIHQDYGIEFQNAKKKIEASLPTTDISKLFDISSIDPVIRVDKLIEDTNNKPVHFSNYYLLGSRVSLHIDIRMDG